jgi:hypothetical protein
MLARLTVAVAAACAVLLLLWGRSGPTEQLFVTPAMVKSVPTLPRAQSVMAGGAGNGDKPKTPRKKGFKAPAWMRQCEYAWDCDAPMECCEFAGASFCCRGGIGVPSFVPQPQLIPIPVPVPSPQRYPPPGGGYPGNYPY